MRRLRVVVAGTAGLCLAGAIAPSPAAASFEITSVECKEGIPTLCLELEGKLFEAKGEETYHGKLVEGTEALLSATFGTEVIHITCTKDASTGKIVQAEPLIRAVVTRGGILTFSGCRLLEPLGKKCSLAETLITKALQGTVNDEMPIRNGIIKPETGPVFIEIEFKNNGTETCPATIKGTKKVTGEDTCSGVEAEVDKVVHVGECAAAGSKIKLGENEAVFECKTEVELSGGNERKPWDVSLG